MKTTLRAVAFFLWCLVMLAASPPARAQPCTSAWHPATGAASIDGYVHAFAHWDPDGPGPNPTLLLVAGEFSAAGDIPAGNLAAWDGRQWSTPLGSTNGLILAIAINGNRVVIAGQFTSVAGVAAKNVAEWDGTQWRALAGGLDAAAYAATYYNGDLIVGGIFGAADAVPGTSRIARWDGSAWHAMSGGITGHGVYTLATYTGDLYAAGLFAFAGGQPINAIVRWNGTTWSAVGSGLVGIRLDSLAVFDGRLIAAGEFSASGPTSLPNVAAWDGSTWTPLGSGFVAGAANATVIDGSLYVTSRLNPSTTPDTIYRWSGTQWNPAVPADPLFRLNNINALASYNSRFVIGGFLFVDGNPGSGLSTRFGILAYDASGWDTLGRGLGAPVRAFAEFQGDLILGGDFSVAGGRRVNHVTRWDGTTFHPLGTGVGSTTPLIGNGVRAMTVFRNELIVAGKFQFAAGAPAAGIAAWNGTTWRPLASGLGVGSSAIVHALLVHDDTLYAAGEYMLINGTQQVSIAKWDGAQWSSVGTTTNAITGGVLALHSFQGHIIAGGYVLTANGHPSRGAARWNGSTWLPMPLPGVGNVHAFSIFRDRLVAATACYCDTPPRLLEWRGDHWAIVLSLFGGSLQSLAVFNNELIIGGGINTPGPVSIFGIARWDGSQLRPLGAGLSGYASTLHSTPTRLLVGGEFKSAGGQQSYYWASTACEPPPACYANCDYSSIPSVLSVSDFLCFQAAFAAGEGYTNCDESAVPPVLDVRDFICFMNAFARGCP
ncbi:MAG: hypothetical protein ACKVW3_05530 [Phycisphaerales bacterium]